MKTRLYTSVIIVLILALAFILKMMVNYLTSEKGMSFRRIEKEIGISRETLRMLKISK